jgi:hypothetical protein
MSIKTLKSISILFFIKVYKTIKKGPFIRLNESILLILSVNMFKKETFLRLALFLDLYLQYL